MQTQFKLAVITPVFNGKKYISRAIESVKYQTIPNLRHYIYNDCSHDGTEEILNQFFDDPNIIIKNGDTNRGQSHGRNVLISQALNDGCTHIAFLDADDQWDPDHIETSLLTLEDNDIVYSFPRCILEDGRPGVFYGIPVPKLFIGKQLLHNNFIWISSVVAKSEIFRGVEFDSRLDSVEDWDMWIHQYKLGRKFIAKQASSINYISSPEGSAGQGYKKMPLFNEKNGRLDKLKLHLACGHDYQPDYINIDFYPVEGVRTDAEFDVSTLPYDDNTIDEIRAFHIIEHFDWYQGQRTLEEWFRVLKPGGRIWLETPDFLASCDAFVKGSQEFRILLYNHFFATPWVPGQTHKFLFTEDQLACQLGWAGFKQIRRLPPASGYVLPETYNLFLNMEAYK